MTTTFSQPTGQPGYPLQPTAEGPQVPRGLDVDAPGHTPIPQRAEHTPASAYNNPTDTPIALSSVTGTNTNETPNYGTTGDRDNDYANFADTSHTGPQFAGVVQPTMGYVKTTGSNVGANTLSAGNVVLDIQAPDLKTIVVTGYGTGYTMTTTYENHRELVTIRRGTSMTARAGANMTTTDAGVNTTTGANTTNLPPSQAAFGTTDTEATTETAEEPFLAQVEPHQVRATKISLKGGPQIKLKDWLGGRGTAVHSFDEGGKTYEWRKSFQGLHRKLELFVTDEPETQLAWAEKVSTTDETQKEHEAGRPPLPANPGTAKLTVTERAVPFIDTIVVSFLLIDRETRNDPLH